MRPTWKSNAAPTPIITLVSNFPMCAAIHFSCFGVLKPTQVISGESFSKMYCSSFSSSVFNGLNGGQHRGMKGCPPPGSAVRQHFPHQLGDLLEANLIQADHRRCYTIP